MKSPLTDCVLSEGFKSCEAHGHLRREHQDEVTNRHVQSLGNGVFIFTVFLVIVFPDSDYSFILLLFGLSLVIEPVLSTQMWCTQTPDALQSDVGVFPVMAIY